MEKWEKVVVLHRMLKSRKYCIPLKTVTAELGCSEATFHRIRGFMQTNLGAHSETDLRKGIVRSLKNFIIEFGRDFAFVGEEYRVQVGMKDFFLDLPGIDYAIF